MFRIGSLCGWLSVLVLEIFLVVMSLRFLRSCWRDRKCWFLFYFFLFGCVTIFFFSTRRTQDEITSQLFNMNASEYVPLPELTQEDPVPLSSLSLIFHSIYVALDATWDAGKLWSVAVLLVLSPIIRLTVAVMIVVGPILKDVLKRLGEMFLAQDPMNIYLEIGTVVAVVLLWLLKRHIQRARYFISTLLFPKPPFFFLYLFIYFFLFFSFLFFSFLFFSFLFFSFLFFSFLFFSFLFFSFLFFSFLFFSFLFFSFLFFSFLFFYFILFYFILFYFILFYFILFYFILFYFILFYFFFIFSPSFLFLPLLFQKTIFTTPFPTIFHPFSLDT